MTVDTFDTVVIGGGIAGISAASVVARDGWRACVVDEMGGGGRLVNLELVHDFPRVGADASGPELAADLIESAVSLGVHLVFDRAQTFTRTADDGLEVMYSAGALRARSVVLATGHEDGRLGLDGERELVGRGISHCASCDGPLYQGVAVAVVGAGDWAVEEALHLAQYASAVTLVCPQPQLACGRVRREALEASDVTCLVDVSPSAFRVDDGVLRGLVVDGLLGPDFVPAEGVFPLIGMRPALSTVPPGFAHDPSGVVTDAELADACGSGIYMAGDVLRTGDGTLRQAAAGGLATGATVSEFLARV